MIELSTIQEMFANISSRSKWDMAGPMLWGYFFTDESREKLMSVVEELEHAGYRFVEIFDADIDEGETPFYFLHVERAEVHSPQSLHGRNAELYAFADRHGLGSYDGMDVGPVGGPTINEV